LAIFTALEPPPDAPGGEAALAFFEELVLLPPPQPARTIAVAAMTRNDAMWRWGLIPCSVRLWPATL
jgi:hypothetical protein